MPEMSHKRERFVLLSVRRLEQTQHMLRLIGNLSGHAYEWQPDEVEDLFAGVRQAVDAAERKFHQARRWPDAHPAKQYVLN